MLSYLHELLVNLFRNRTDSTTILLGDLDVPLPEHDAIQTESTNIKDLKPAEYRADLVLFLINRARKVLGVIVEIRLGRDENKKYSWPAYVANLHARHRCPICLLVITLEKGISHWAQATIELGPGTHCRPWVIGPSNTRAITTLKDAEQNVELAVLSAIEHGHNSDQVMAERITCVAAACRRIDDDRSKLYLDLISLSLAGCAPEALEVAMNSLGFEYQSDFARRYIAEGRTEGRTEGRAAGVIEGRIETILKVLDVRFGTLSETNRTRVRGARDIVLDKVEDEMMSAKTIEQVLELLK